MLRGGKFAWLPVLDVSSRNDSRFVALYRLCNPSCMAICRRLVGFPCYSANFPASGLHCQALAFSLWYSVLCRCTNFIADAPGTFHLLYIAFLVCFRLCLRCSCFCLFWHLPRLSFACPFLLPDFLRSLP